MSRRSSSSRWSKPATRKQIASLKARGTYDGKYYSMGRASQTIAKGSSAPVRSRTYLAGAASPFGSEPAAELPPLWAFDLVPRLEVELPELAVKLKPAFQRHARTVSVSDTSNRLDVITEFLEVPNDLDSLVRAALEREDASRNDTDPVESVAFTVRTHESDSDSSNVVVEVEVVRSADFEGSPSVHLRFVEAQRGSPAGNRDRDVLTTLFYRPSWSPELVETPSEMAQQMRVHWRAAVEELERGVDPRAMTFLAAAGGMETAIAILNSPQTVTSKFIQLQGVLDPDGDVEFQGIRLDAESIAQQICQANEGDPESLEWLGVVEGDHVLTSLAEVTGLRFAAQADYQLERWRAQADALIVTVTSEASREGVDLSSLRSERLESAALLGPQASGPDDAELQRLRFLIALRKAAGLSGLAEDWFLEDVRAVLRARFEGSLPNRFALALTPAEDENEIREAVANEARRLAAESSSALKDPAFALLSKPGSPRDRSFFSLGGPDPRRPFAHRLERFAQAVQAAVRAVSEAADDDLGSLLAAREVLAYAEWRHSVVRASSVASELYDRNEASQVRAKQAAKRADQAKKRRRARQAQSDLVRGIDASVEALKEKFASTTASITIGEPLPEPTLAAAESRLAKAVERGSVAEKWLADAHDDERWYISQLGQSQLPTLQAWIEDAHDSAVKEQARARGEQQEAAREQSEASRHLRDVLAARERFLAGVRDVVETNELRRTREMEMRRAAAAAQERERQIQRQIVEEERARRATAEAQRKHTNEKRSARNRVAKVTITKLISELLNLPAAAPFWRRRALSSRRAEIMAQLREAQAEIAMLLGSDRERPHPRLVLSPLDRYLGEVRKRADYGLFVKLPAGTDGLLRGAEADGLNIGEFVVVEIVEIPLAKPVVLRRLRS